MSAQTDLMFGVCLSQAHCSDAHGHFYHSEEPILFPSVRMGLFGKVLLPKGFAVTREALLMKISTVRGDTKLIELGQQDQCCAVGKGGKDVRPNARLAVRVKIIFISSFCAVRDRVHKKQTAQTYLSVCTGKTLLSESHQTWLHPDPFL